jgi:hypothetical protein
MPTRFKFNYYNQVYWDWYYTFYSFEEAETNLNGMAMEAIVVDETHKAQEWFLPWAQLGNGGVIGLLDGRRFGFTGGYNDSDGDGKFVNCLRWKNMDPYQGPTRIAEAELLFETTWGDLHMAEGIGVSDWDTRKPPRVIDPRRPFAAPGLNVQSVEYFTLQGRKLTPEAAQRMLRNHGAALVQRVLLQDGTFRSAITPKLAR